MLRPASLALICSCLCLAQTAPPKATDVPGEDIEAIAKSIGAGVGDLAARVVNVNNDYNVGVYVVHFPKTTGPSAGNGQMHHLITEVYYVRKGAGTLVTGGALENPKESAPDANNVRTQVGPTAAGKVIGGATRKIKEGDVFIVPPDTPHYLSEVTEDIEYVIVRMDPRKLLPIK
jgi:mannose-6-phosphate isomerase-like protein (cupin superfamily)